MDLSVTIRVASAGTEIVLASRRGVPVPLAAVLYSIVTSAAAAPSMLETTMLLILRTLPLPDALAIIIALDVVSTLPKVLPLILVTLTKFGFAFYFP